jgi:hypothetical protein
VIRIVGEGRRGARAKGIATLAKGQHLSAYQQKIVRRYYNNLDTLALQKLSEAVGELYLCEDAKKRTRLWASVETALRNAKVDPVKIARVLESQDVKLLAELVNSLAGKK